METFIKNLARGAGEILKDGFGKKLKVSTKSAKFDWVTQYDKKSDEFIIDRIRKKYPDHGILTEESGELIKKDDFWIVDPLDGTIGFVLNIPVFCVSIAFVSKNKIKMGAIYVPITGELFFAADGKGAFLNNKKIFVSQTSEIKGSHGHAYSGYKKTTKQDKLILNKNLIETEARRFGIPSAAVIFGLVACGRLDFTTTKGLYPWDFAAGAIIMKEAGAQVTDFAGKEFRWDSNSIVAANPVLHKKIMKNFKLP
jgi:myo-inositol-1(or 4)-monophosphatase